MKFTKVDAPNYRADKVSNTGAVYYAYWVDEQINQYVQIVSIEGGRDAGTGTYSEHLFAVIILGTPNQLNGYYQTTVISITSRDNNMSVFLKAVTLDVEKRKQEDTTKKAN